MVCVGGVAFLIHRVLTIHPCRSMAALQASAGFQRLEDYDTRWVKGRGLHGTFVMVYMTLMMDVQVGCFGVNGTHSAARACCWNVVGGV